MGLFDFLKKSDKLQKAQNTPFVKSKYADASSITDDERPFYQPDEYYTYVTHPDTQFETRVLTFEERKRLSYPSQAWARCEQCSKSLILQAFSSLFYNSYQYITNGIYPE